MDFTELEAAFKDVHAGKATILATLPGKRDATDDDRVIMDIAMAVYRDVAERSRTTPTNGRRLTLSKRRGHLRKLAGALATARVLLNDTLNRPLSDDMGWEYDNPAAVTPRLYNDAMGPLANIEAMAAEAAKRVPVRRGPLSGNHIVNPDLYRSLASIYTEATGQKAGKGDGPFVEFAGAVVRAAGIETPPDYDSKEPIKDALSHGRYAAKKETRRRERRSRDR
jgi:hypothetical protein